MIGCKNKRNAILCSLLVWSKIENIRFQIDDAQMLGAAIGSALTECGSHSSGSGTYAEACFIFHFLNRIPCLGEHKKLSKKMIPVEKAIDPEMEVSSQ